MGVFAIQYGTKEKYAHARACTGRGRCVWRPAFRARAADSPTRRPLRTHPALPSFERTEPKTDEEIVAIRKEEAGYDLGTANLQPLASETAVVNWPSIATGEGHFVLGTYTLTVPFTTAMKVIVKKYVANAALRLGGGYGRRATD